jgi:hypothetical protein
MLAVLGQALQDCVVMFVLLHCWTEIDSACGLIVLLCDKFSHSVLAK